MYQFDDVGSTFLSLPPNLQTTENECFGYALDRQLKRMHELAKQITVWSNLDNVDPKYYDSLAMTIRAPYYRSEYSNKQKLGLIKSALLTRRNAGTIKAIEELLSHTLSAASFIPWYKYGGNPYFFRVTADVDEVDSGSMGEFIRKISAVKSARSIFDGVAINAKIDSSALNGIRLDRVCFWIKIPFYPSRAYDGVVRYDGSTRYDAKRKYKLGMSLEMQYGIEAPRESVGHLEVETRRNVQYYNGKKKYDGTTKYNAMIRRDKIE